MKVAIILNEQRKDAQQLDKKLLDEMANKYQLDYSFFIAKADEMEELIKTLSAQTFNAFLICGGDGTVRTAAQVLVDQDIPIAILPLGTFNYFAKALEYPNDIETIFKIIKNKKTKLVDVGEINNIIFINHATIGFYSHILKLKEKHKDMLGKNKLLKVIFTAFNFFNVLPIYTLTMQVDNKTTTVQTCLVFIGNNHHFTSLLDFGKRETLSAGLLAIYILNCKTRWEVFKCVLSVLLNTFAKEKYLTQYISTNLTIVAESKLINVVIDGELFKLESPLNFTTHNKKLTVFVP